MVSNRYNRRRANKGTPPICKSKKPLPPGPPLILLALDPHWIEYYEDFWGIGGTVKVSHPFYPVAEAAVAHFWTEPDFVGPWSGPIFNFVSQSISTPGTSAPYTLEVYVTVIFADGGGASTHATCPFDWVPMMHYRPTLPPLPGPFLPGEIRLPPRRGPLAPP